MKKLLLGLVAILSITTMAATKEGTGLGYKDDILFQLKLKEIKLQLLKLLKWLKLKE